MPSVIESPRRDSCANDVGSSPDTALRADDAGKTIGNIRALPGKSMAVVNLLLSDALMHRFYILGEKIRLAPFKVAGPRFPAVPFDELTVLFRLDDRFERHLNGLRSALRSQDSLGFSQKPVIEP